MILDVARTFDKLYYDLKTFLLKQYTDFELLEEEKANDPFIPMHIPFSSVRVTFDGNTFITSEAVQKGLCRFITQLLIGTGPIYSSICSPGNILL